MAKPVYIVVTPFFPTLTSWRGPFCYDFVVALKKTGKYRVEVFVPGAGDDYEIGGVKVHRFATKLLPSNIFPFLLARWNQRSFLSAVARAGIELEDIVVCHAHTANLATYPLAVKAKNPKCLTLLHHHDPQRFGLNTGVLRHCWLYNILEFPILRKWHERIDSHVFISEVVKRSFLSAPDASWTCYEGYKKQMRGLPYRPVKVRRSIVLHNGVDLNIFKKGDRPKHDGFVIGCIANFSDWKDQMTLLRAVDLFNHEIHERHENRVRVVFVGSGPERRRCEEYAREKGIDAEFRDEVRHEQLPEFYRSIDLFVLPSYFEGFGCVFTEAWACGTPFITCEGQGIEELIPTNERKHWLCRIGDYGDLANKINEYIVSPRCQYLSDDVSIDVAVENFIDRLDKRN